MLLFSIRHGVLFAGGPAGAPGVAPASATASDAALFEAAAPMLRFFGLVEKLQQLLKPAVAGQPWTETLRRR